eukprot:776503-Prymnesium_polylepis.2
MRPHGRFGDATRTGAVRRRLRGQTSVRGRLRLNQPWRECSAAVWAGPGPVGTRHQILVAASHDTLSFPFTCWVDCGTTR